MSKPKPEGKYWQSVDPTASSWHAMELGPPMSWDTSGGEDKDVEKNATTNKPSMVERQSTYSTVIESFSLYGDTLGWETTAPSKRGRKGRIKQMTTHPSFRKRFGICIGIALLFIIAFVSVLAFNLSSGGSASGVTGTDPNVTNTGGGPDTNGPDTGGGGADTGNVPDTGGDTDTNATETDIADTGGGGTDTGHVPDTGGDTDTNVTETDIPDTGGGDTDTGDVPDTGGDTDTNVTETAIPDTGGGADTGHVPDTGGDTDTNVTDTGDLGTDAGGGGGGTTSTFSIDLTKPASPFSILHPVDDLGMFGVVHKRSPPESVVRGDKSQAVPTNAWYENLLVADGEPTSIHKAYVIPYLVDTVGPIPGLRVHSNHLTATSTTIQLEIVETNGLTLGASSNSNGATNSYSVVSTNPLGLTLKWNALPMRSSIIRGMPYATMHYPKPLSKAIRPTIASEILLEKNGVVADGVVDDCTTLSRVNSELKLTFVSDFTWMVFFSEPVLVQCLENRNGGVEFQVVGLQDDETSLDDLTIRSALLTNCTNGNNAIYCTDQPESTIPYEKLLRKRAHLYPGPNADIRYGVDSEKGVLRLDWDVQSTTSKEQKGAKDLIAYALPHHYNHMDHAMQKGFCTSSLIGPTCVVSGSVWDLEQDLPITSFRAPRPPIPKALSQIAGALQNDIFYNIPDNFKRGAGDTYFSGKILARVARVLLIAEELQDLCQGKARGYNLTRKEKQAYIKTCRNDDITLPSGKHVKASLARLRSAVEVWINGTAEARFAYDSGWGGVISCGCIWNGNDGCSNALPDCPAISDQGLNFGNGYYNDHHFHYGYHIYAAAAVAHFDREWGRTHFEDVLLLIRDIANPSREDTFFPTFRHKDWYQGSSWASGVTQPTFANGMNQESSSEAIAAYEAVALYGQVMMTAWKDAKESSSSSSKKMEVSKRIQEAGIILAATEIRSVDWYWHVRHRRRTNNSKDDKSSTPNMIYPSTYEAGVIGILWSTMAQFTTWFGNAPYLMYGIQLLPLTPIAENRDESQEWLREMYAPLATSCAADYSGCTNGGWSILQLAILATIGNMDMAMEHARQIPASTFDSAGGNGHSLTNTLYYFATRPEVEQPADVSALLLELPQQQDSTITTDNVFALDCGIPDSCTAAVLDTRADGYTCRERITWLVNVQKMTQEAACQQVAVKEYPNPCSPCANTSVGA